jgi:DNA-binding PadR family transcriptional regulator
MNFKNVAKTFRFSERGARLLERLAEQLGLSQAGVLEFLLREEADRRGIRVKVKMEKRS